MAVGGKVPLLHLCLALIIVGCWGVPISPRVSSNATKVQVALYYETLCPYCRKLISGELSKAVSALGEIMHPSLHPWGNAK